MQNYNRYEVEQRNYSSNVVLGFYQYVNDKNETKEKSDIIIVPTLRKEDGDKHAQFVCDCLNNKDFGNTIMHLSKNGFLCEIVTDGWANWKFKDNRPDIETATPLYVDPDEFGHVYWRGCYWYFDKNTKKLVQDDVGMYENINTCILALFKTYHNLIDEIDINAFNNPNNK